MYTQSAVALPLVRFGDHAVADVVDYAVRGAQPGLRVADFLETHAVAVECVVGVEHGVAERVPFFRVRCADAPTCQCGARRDGADRRGEFSPEGLRIHLSP